ncbi:hypothetical protein BJ944DRAFT_270809 [Cunninghamella echinulata]|nr:hypothetical protein BJ944DRAFT_270809 [Cunninghamella echinulata]
MTHKLKIKYLVLALLSIVTCVNGITVYDKENYEGSSSIISIDQCVNLENPIKSIRMESGKSCTGYSKSDCQPPFTNFYNDTPSITDSQVSISCTAEGY